MGQSIQTIKEDGVDDETAHTVIPMGATINMDGSGMYQMFAAMFVMSLSGVSTDFFSMLPLVLAIVLASIGTPGAPGVSLFILIRWLGIKKSVYVKFGNSSVILSVKKI